MAWLVRDPASLAGCAGNISAPLAIHRAEQPALPGQLRQQITASSLGAVTRAIMARRQWW
ncbi:MAG: hypothetical protein IPK19_30115 [Chloroflexi bacterium]|nr:hypothetical protein [Chloroflexota bacterium]